MAKFTVSKTVTFLKKTVNGRKVMMNRVDVSNASFEEVKRHIKVYRNTLVKDGGSGDYMQICMKYKGMRPMSATSFKIGGNEPIKIFDPQDSPTIEERPEIEWYVVSVIPRARNIGGTGGDGKNDCLWHAIRLCVEKIPEGFGRPCLIKTKLGLDRCAAIPIEKITMLEDLMKITIDVTGDHLYHSTKDYPQKITISLINGHYDKAVVKGERHAEMKDLFLAKKEDTKIVLYFHDYDTGTTTYINERQERVSEDSSNNRGYLTKYRNEFIFVDGDNKSISNLLSKGATYEEKYTEYIEMCNELKKRTHGLINLYRTFNIKGAVLSYLYLTTKSICPQPIDMFECEFLERATRGAIIHNVTANTAGTHLYDIVSMYPSALTRMPIPVKSPTYLKLTQDFIDELITEYRTTFKTKLCIVRCDINPKESTIDTDEDTYTDTTTTTKTKNPKIKLFRFSSLKYYTNFDIEAAIILGYSIQIITDLNGGIFNVALYHENGIMKGSEVFGKFVNQIFVLKAEKVRGAKECLNILWGGLSERSRIKRYDNDDNGEINGIVMGHRQLDNTGSNHIYSIADVSKPYKTNYARIKPFLLSYCRRRMIQEIAKYKIEDADIVRIHTDGMHLRKMYEIRCSEKMGDFKYKYIKPVLAVSNSSLVV